MLQHYLVVHFLCTRGMVVDAGVANKQMNHFMVYMWYTFFSNVSLGGGERTAEWFNGIGRDLFLSPFFSLVK